MPIALFLVIHGCPCGWVNVVLGGIALLTDLSGFCLLYLPFGISTARATRPVAR